MCTKVSDKMAYANSADPDQTAPEGVVRSESTLFAIPQNILINSCIKSKIEAKKYGIKCSNFRTFTGAASLSFLMYSEYFA